MERRWVSLLLRLSIVAATTEEVHQAMEQQLSPSGPPRVFTLKSTTTEEVPTFYHLTEYAGLVCNGTAFTDNKALGCHGWHGLSEFECKKKCAAAEQLDSCPNKLCFAIAYHQGGGGWCHLYDHANCLGMESGTDVATFKKEHGNTGGMASINTSNIDLRAVAMAAGAALVAAAEMSARHRARIAGNFSTTLAHDHFGDLGRHLTTTPPVAHDHSLHITTTPIVASLHITTTPIVASAGHENSHLDPTPTVQFDFRHNQTVHTKAGDHPPLGVAGDHRKGAALAEIFTTTPLGIAAGAAGAAPRPLTSTPYPGSIPPVAGHREGHDPAQLITNKPPVVNSKPAGVNPVPSDAAGAPKVPSGAAAADGSTPQRGGSSGSSGSLAPPHAMIVIPGLLVMCVCCGLLGQALIKRRDRGEEGIAGVDFPNRYPGDLE